MGDTWKSLGFDSEGGFKRLLYSGARDRIFVNVVSEDGGLVVWKMYTRGMRDKRYFKIQGLSPQLSYHDPVLISNETQVLINVFTAENKDGTSHYDWSGLAIIDIDSLTVRYGIFGQDEMSKYGSGWIAQLHNVSSDGGRIFCAAAFPATQDGVTTSFNYWLCALTLSTKELTRITKLEGVFV